jgi:hypothetical protein
MYLTLTWSYFTNCKLNIAIVDNFLNELNDLEDDEQ